MNNSRKSIPTGISLMILSAIYSRILPAINPGISPLSRNVSNKLPRITTGNLQSQKFNNPSKNPNEVSPEIIPEFPPKILQKSLLNLSMSFSRNPLGTPPEISSFKITQVFTRHAFFTLFFLNNVVFTSFFV